MHFLFCNRHCHIIYKTKTNNKPAHCVTCEQTSVDLRRTLTDPPDPNAESHDILYWIQHPNYEQPTISSYDIALVVLSGTTEIEPIELVPPKISTSNVYPEGTPMDILGYGFIDEADTIISDQLQHGIITSWDKSECQIYLDEFCGYGDRWDNNAMLCGFDPDISTERGDSGGPGLMNGLLAGINSWSPPTENCQSISGPDYQILDVFVDVGSVRHWIEDAKPTQDTYFVGIHICDDVASTSGDNVLCVIYEDYTLHCLSLCYCFYNNNQMDYSQHYMEVMVEVHKLCK